MITIQSALRSLTVTGKYRGYRYTAIALHLILKDEDWLFDLKGKLYPQIADLCHCSVASVTSDISYYSKKVWACNAEKLKEWARIPLYKAPSNGEFLTIIYNYIKRS